MQCLYFNVPIIGRNIRGLNDIVVNKKYGYLIENDFVDKSVFYLNQLYEKKIKIIKKNISKINFKKFSRKKISKNNIYIKKTMKFRLVIINRDFKKFKDYFF